MYSYFKRDAVALNRLQLTNIVFDKHLLQNRLKDEIKSCREQNASCGSKHVEYHELHIIFASISIALFKQVKFIVLLAPMPTQNIAKHSMQLEYFVNR